MNGSIIIASIAVVISFLSLVLSLVNSNRDKKLKFLGKKTEILNALTRAKMLSINNSFDLREIFNKISEKDVVTEKMLRIDRKIHQVDIEIEKLYSVAENVTYKTYQSQLESLLKKANFTFITLTSLVKDFVELKK